MIVPRRSILLVALPVLVLGSVSGCTKLGPGNDHGAKSSTVVYSVTGTGQAEVQYAATATSRMTTREGATLPFSTTVTTIDHSQTIYSVSARNGAGLSGCSIEVNGVVVYKATSGNGSSVRCFYVK